METASRRKIDRVASFALQHNALFSHAWARYGDHGKQCPGKDTVDPSTQLLCVGKQKLHQRYITAIQSAHQVERRIVLTGSVVYILYHFTLILK